MRFLLLVAALAGCHNPGSDTDPVGINPDDTANPDDTGVNPSTLGYLDANALVLGLEEPCMASVFDASGEVAGTDLTGDDELLSLKEGDYTVSFGLAAEALFPDDEEYAEAVADVVDDLYLHQDANGDLWTGLVQPFTVIAGDTIPVAGELSLVPAMCPLDEDGCNGQNDEVGQWTCEIGSNTYQEPIEVNQFREEDWLTISVPCIGDLVLEGDRIYDDTHEGGFITAGWIEVYDLNDSSNDVVLWVGRDGDKP